MNIAGRIDERIAQHAFLPARKENMRWGYFSKKEEPVLRLQSGDFATIETLTHHAGDDYDLLVRGDIDAEGVYAWSPGNKAMDRRGAGAVIGAAARIRGAGEGLGVHLLTGPIHIEGAERGDILEVRILDVKPRPCCHPQFRGRTFGVNAAASWGLHFCELVEPPIKREVVTVFELDATGRENWATAAYSYVWTPQTDPDGILHAMIDYPGVVVDHDTIEKRFNVLKDVRVPARLHFGTMGVAPSEADYVSSIPPSYSGGNIDNWRMGRGASMYFPVAVPGALFSVGDPHACQGDAELCGTAIETSLTGVFQFVLHKAASLQGTIMEGLDYPLLETDSEWVVHGFTHANYLEALGADAQRIIVERSSLDGAMRDAFRKTRRFLMVTQALTEDEAVTLMSVGVDFAVTQVVDANWGVHAVIRKSLFAGRRGKHPQR